MRKLIALLTVMAVAVITMTAETKTVTFTVTPQMSCQNCENKIKNNLRFEKGIVDVQPSAKKQTVVVKYNDSKTDVDKLITNFKKIGYDATVKPASEKTKTDKK